jgi:TRAP-type C4-dicarboxylate transport system permease small subunit
MFTLPTVTSLTPAAHWLQRRAEEIAVALIAVMFLGFIVQIVFRYLLNFPIGWTSELSSITWTWLVLWGAAFVVREEEEIRLDIIYGSVSRNGRRYMSLFVAAALVVLYTISLPAVTAYVTFMKVQESPYLNIRFDYLFSIYVIFAVASIIRYIWLGWRALKGDAPELDPTKAGSGV